jgi:hypothetical protein
MSDSVITQDILDRSQCGQPARTEYYTLSNK